MLDEIFFKRGYHKHKIDYILFGFLIAIVGMITSFLIFGINSSQAQLVIIALLITPAIIKIMQKEEKVIRKPGLNYIHENHKNVFKIFIFLFIGIFIAFFLMQLILMTVGYDIRTICSFQTDMLDNNYVLSYGILEDKSELGSFVGLSFSLISKVSLIIIACFVLSFLYGAGGIFVMITAASVLSTSIIYLMKSTQFFMFSLLYVLFFLILLIPILLSSIAGGVICKAFVHEKMRSKYFREVIKEGIVIFGEALIIAIIISLIWCGFLFIF